MVDTKLLWITTKNVTLTLMVSTICHRQCEVLLDSIPEAA